MECEPTEIFEKARVYARNAEIEEGRFHLLPPYVCNDGERRLHAQAVKLFNMAIDMAQEVPYQHDESFRTAVLTKINLLQARYAQVWETEEDGYCYKDFTSPDRLIDMLGFLRRMGVSYTREDRESLSEALHLRVSPEDFGKIFNPSSFSARQGREL